MSGKRRLRNTFKLDGSHLLKRKAVDVDEDEADDDDDMPRKQSITALGGGGGMRGGGGSHETSAK